MGVSFIKFKNNLYTAEATTNYRIIHRTYFGHPFINILAIPIAAGFL